MELTIAGFEELSTQQMFDMAAEHIQNTRIRSTTIGKTGCTYTGSGCAASIFIKPDLRDKADMTGGGSWFGLVYANAVSPHNAELVAELQSAHDSTESKADSNGFMKTWNENMRRVADRHSLDVSKLENL